MGWFMVLKKKNAAAGGVLPQSQQFLVPVPVMTVLILLSLSSDRFRLLSRFSRTVFGTVLTFSKVDILNTFLACFTLANVMNTWINSVFHDLNSLSFV